MFQQKCEGQTIYNKPKKSKCTVSVEKEACCTMVCCLQSTLSVLWVKSLAYMLEFAACCKCYIHGLPGLKVAFIIEHLQPILYSATDIQGTQTFFQPSTSFFFTMCTHSPDQDSSTVRPPCGDLLPYQVCLSSPARLTRPSRCGRRTRTPRCKAHS